MVINSQAQEECQFFYKVGACRHGSKCVRKHTIPASSRAIVLMNIPLPSGGPGRGQNRAEIERMIQDVFIEISSIARIKEIFVAANEAAHLKGTVYIAFASEHDAESVLTNINSRWFNGHPLFAHYLPSQVLHMAVCREGDRCQRKLDCNYAHALDLDGIWPQLFAAQSKEYSNSRLETPC